MYPLCMTFFQGSIIVCTQVSFQPFSCGPHPGAHFQRG